MQSQVRANNNVNMNQIKSPNIQQPRVFERKSVNKQFDRAEVGNGGSNIESTRHNDTNVTDITTERSSDIERNSNRDIQSNNNKINTDQ